jgi:hypothetical protein
MDDVNSLAKEGLILQNYKTENVVKNSPMFGDGGKSKAAL